MSSSKDDEIGSWSIQKLELLEKYLSAYVTVLSNQSWCRGYEYIDAFAGSGKPMSRDAQEYVDGSPVRALKLAKPFTKYHFIEKSKWRLQRLEELKVEFNDRQIEIYEGDCNENLKVDIIPALSLESFKRAIAFIDPCGT